MKTVNYFDIPFDFNISKYKSYQKSYGKTNYVNVKSNTPPNIIKLIPLSIQNYLSNHYTNKKISQQAIPHYRSGSERSGYNHNFEYKPTVKRSWFNLLFNSNTSTSIRFFLNLIRTHF